MTGDMATQDKKSFRFHEVKFQTLEGRTVVRLTPENLPDGEKTDFYIEASGAGIHFRGDFLLREMSMLQPLARAIGSAVKHHKLLKPRIVSTLAGH